MPKKQSQKKGCRKAGRNKRTVDDATSKFVRGKVSFEAYAKSKGLKTKK